MSTSITIVAGDTQPLITVTLTSSDTATDFTKATALTLDIGPSKTVTTTITTKTTTQLVATWQYDGTLAEGVYDVRAAITWSDASTQHDTGAAMTITVQPTP